MEVSAIVSAYYAEPYLAGRIENLLHHDCQIVIVCQDGSAEHAIAQDMLSAKLHIITTTPDIPTVYAAWNAGIQVASGQYITNANSDDRHYPGSIATLKEALDSHPEHAVAYPDVHRFAEIDGDEPIGQFTWKEGGFEDLMHGCFLGPMPMWRKSLHDKYGLFEEEYTVAGDYEFWLRIAKAGESFYHIKQVLGAHLEHDNGLEHRAPLRTLWETARARATHK